LAELEAAKVPAGPILSPQQLLDDPHVKAANYFARAAYPGLERPAPIPATPVRLSETPGTVRTPPPELGQHTDEILRGLGFTKADIESLRASGAV
jgi:crotonobetainyl-CoA:carnitine CoA-transferase CaiB-like acyl-CoA transferase